MTIVEREGLLMEGDFPLLFWIERNHDGLWYVVGEVWMGELQMRGVFTMPLSNKAEAKQFAYHLTIGLIDKAEQENRTRDSSDLPDLTT